MLAKPVVEIAPRTWLISEYKLVNMYLLEGDEAALLIDCGTGIGNAAETVRELTDKPLTVAITHGHFDHDGRSRTVSGNSPASDGYQAVGGGLCPR